MVVLLFLPGQFVPQAQDISSDSVCVFRLEPRLEPGHTDLRAGPVDDYFPVFIEDRRGRKVEIGQDASSAEGSLRFLRSLAIRFR